jgi:hypothetical protein
MRYQVHVKEKPAVVLTFRSLKDAEEIARQVRGNGQHPTVLEVGTRCWAEPGVPPPKQEVRTRRAPQRRR